MTDKQIIIDGVDVSGCKNFSCGKCEEENKIPITINHFTADCRMYPNCYYKQLKRKEQECEELKNAYTRLNSLYNDNCNFTDKLEQTLTEIKEIADRIVNDYEWNQATRMSEEAEQILQKISESEVEKC